MAKRRCASAVVALTALTAVLAGCSDDDGTGTEGTANQNVTLKWWHNGTGEPLLGLWQSVADDFMKAHPGVKVEVSAVQNEELQKTKIPVALQSGNPPDLFQQWGGGELAGQVEAGKVLDISDKVTEELGLIGGSAAGWQVEGKTYGLPFSLGVEGFWYNKALFAKAGITAPPANLTEFNDDVAKLKAKNIVPVVVGAKDQWPAAHYWYNLALRNCSVDTMKKAGVDFTFTDPCFVKAGEDLQKFIASDPFQKGYLGTSAQQGATSSAGMLANGKAAMELMGHWNPGVMGGLTEDGKGLGDDLGWFPFPAVEGSAGDPAAALGGGDGFSCSYKAPPQCVDLLKYISSVEVQKKFAESNSGLPVTKGSESGVTDPNMKTLLEFRNKASYVQLWLDVAYGQAIGGALNEAVGQLFAKKGSPQEVVDAMTTAAANK
jgi:raffinose/stachyose/melibiose transport system substrate-binding protein